MGERFVIPKKIDPCCHVFIQCYNTLDLLWKFLLVESMQSIACVVDICSRYWVTMSSSKFG